MDTLPSVILPLKSNGVRVGSAAIETALTYSEAKCSRFYVSLPELASLVKSKGIRSAVLDGEIVAFDRNGLPNFSKLQRRMLLGPDANIASVAASTPITT